MEVLPDLLSWFDSRKRAVSRKLADAMTQGPTATLARMNAQRQEDIGQRNQQTVDMVNRGDWKGLAGMSSDDTVDPGPGGKAIIAGIAAKSGAGRQLKMAQAAQEGQNSGQIWKQQLAEEHPQTGEFNWEIPDQTAKFHPAVEAPFNRGQNVKGRASSMLDHPELWKEYPDLAEHQVVLSKRTEGSGAYFRPEDPWELPAGAEAYPKGALHVEARNLDEARQIMLHELQHGVQYHEGWQYTGSSVEQEGRKLDALARLGQGPKYNELEKDKKAFQAYITEPGELQAAAVENRRNASPELLQTQPPSETMDKIYKYLTQVLK